MNETELAHYSAALDEIYRLRTILALQAMGTAADLDLKSFPKSRRMWAEKRLVEAESSSLGNSVRILSETNPHAIATAQRVVGLSGLTRHQWETRS